MNKILIPKEGNSTFTMIYAKTGSRNEPENIKGVSHFLEHLMFKGTQTKTAKQLAYAIEKYGADLNAFTDHEITAYWIKSANKYKDEAVDILKDMLYNSTFPQVEMDKERNVVIQELKMYEDNPREVAWDAFFKALFDKQDGLHLPIIGTQESLANIDRNILINYYKENYKDLTLVQVGDVEEAVDINSSSKFALPPTQRAILKSETDNILVIKKKGISQANIIIGNVIHPDGTNRLDKNFMFDIILGVFNGMSGRLFSKVREEHNLCYRIHLGIAPFSCGSYIWYVSLGLEQDKIDFAYNLIMEELKRPITPDEIQYALTKKLGETAMYFDNVGAIARTTAYSDLRGVDYKERIFNYEKHLKNAINIASAIKYLNFSNNIIVKVIPEE
jgi:predicted Zn-dependent peptidase